MAIGFVFDAAGVTREQYDQVLHQVSPNGEVAPGLLRHIAGAKEDGIMVVELWESQEALSAFFADKLGAALQAAGITGQPQFFEIFNDYGG